MQLYNPARIRLSKLKNTLLHSYDNVLSSSAYIHTHQANCSVLYIMTDDSGT